MGSQRSAAVGVGLMTMATPIRGFTPIRPALSARDLAAAAAAIAAGGSEALE
jgi:hypothetical protein